jgi:hypothetical protein
MHTLVSGEQPGNYSLAPYPEKEKVAGYSSEIACGASERERQGLLCHNPSPLSRWRSD